MYLDRLFKLMADKQASDLYITCGAPINIKVNGVVQPVSSQSMDVETVRRIAYDLMSKEQGASAVLAVASVGGIRDCHPGDLVLPHQLIDYTSGRAQTFFDGGDQNVVHVDFTHPYTPSLRAHVLEAAQGAGVAAIDGGVYGAVSGPRLETAAEIDRMERDGATLVGMTGMPEAALARELGLPYAAICVVVNHAAGRERQAGLLH